MNATHHHRHHAALGAGALGMAWSIAATRSRGATCTVAGLCAVNRPFKRVFAAF
jgi:hypothetical protein